MRTILLLAAVYTAAITGCAGLAVRELARDSYPYAAPECDNGQRFTEWCGCAPPILPPDPVSGDPGDC